MATPVCTLWDPTMVRGGLPTASYQNGVTAILKVFLIEAGFVAAWVSNNVDDEERGVAKSQHDPLHSPGEKD